MLSFQFSMTARFLHFFLVSFYSYGSLFPIIQIFAANFIFLIIHHLLQNHAIMIFSSIVFHSFSPSSPFLMADTTPPPPIPLSFAIASSCFRLSRENTNIFTRFPKNLIYNYTVPLSFETFPEVIHTILLIREHHYSYLN